VRPHSQAEGAVEHHSTRG